MSYFQRPQTQSDSVLGCVEVPVAAQSPLPSQYQLELLSTCIKVIDAVIQVQLLGKSINVIDVVM